MNISEIAKMAGVSAAAVSRYLNGGSLSGAKREKIQEIIEKTGYRPDTYARSLRTGKMNHIGVIVPKINSESVSHMAAGISEVLSEAGYMILLGNTNQDEEKELEFMNLMQKNHLSGMILMGTVISSKHRQMFRNCKVPLVLTGQCEENMPCVYHDDYHAAGALTHLFIERGYRRIAYLGGPMKDIAAGQNRKKGVEDELKRAKMDLAAFAETAFTEKGGYEAAGRILKSGCSIDAMICASDDIALGAMKAIKNAGYQIGEQIGLAGFDDSELSRLLTPCLTTVRLYHKQSGREAANLLLKLIRADREDGDMSSFHVQMPYEVKVRESVR